VVVVVGVVGMELGMVVVGVVEVVVVERTHMVVGHNHMA